MLKTATSPKPAKSAHHTFKLGELHAHLADIECLWDSALESPASPSPTLTALTLSLYLLPEQKTSEENTQGAG